VATGRGRTGDLRIGGGCRGPRGIAGELRRVGGFAKDTTPFSEFLWADFLRRKLSRKDVENNFSKAIERALALGKSKDAVYLPGWCGPAEED